MRKQHLYLHTAWEFFLVGLAAVLVFAGPALGQNQQDKSASEESKAGPVVRTYGTEGGYRTEVTSETKGTLSQEDRRQVALLAAQVFQHIDEARQALDADDTKLAHKEVDKARQAIRAVHGMLPTTSVRTKTTAPDGKVIYEDERDIQEDRVPLFEGMLHEETLAPIIDAKRDAVDMSGVRVVRSETLNTQAIADLGIVEAQLGCAIKALNEGKADDAAKALTLAQVRGVDFLYSKEDTPLAEARDALWLARRALEENNPTQARVNLDVARQRLRIYREVAPENRRSDVDQMLQEADQLETQLRQETSQQPASRAERSHQGTSVTRWWEQVNSWFKKHF